ncbi:Crp/Fnr family transcriptional regulator [Sphingomonas sanguinis]|uniref:Crp/Fnr family transcriptional regulator n=1 Tax=Sphingomonas sp. LC-1 TaxID=3110957 RepID=UPI0021BB9F45|nr:Crp/Fnr family transcriptional regulator [Sphingomonas sp. LC-1]MCT8002234.1 Crp/Fnr family transcriptional regulator [Sphingomonas sp. LC-1]
MPSDPPPRCAACAAHGVALCGALDRRQIVALNHIGRRRRLAAGQALGWAGDPAATCANLVSGVLKVLRGEPDGRVQIVGLLYPGDFAGILFAERSPDTIVALNDADLCVYPRGALEALLIDQPAIGRLLLRRSWAKLTEARRWMAILACGRAEARVAALLIDMAQRCEADAQGLFRSPLSRGAMAEALGLAIETVSRHMTEFDQQGLIATSGPHRLRLIDPVRLAAIAGCS